jgi:hypothetical protein
MPTGLSNTLRTLFAYSAFLFLIGNTFVTPTLGLELQLEKALPLEGEALLQPSGLVMMDGTLYMVSCQHDDQVFKVSLGSDKANYEEHLRIARPEDAANLKMVWRGISSDGDGHLILLSETAYRALKVARNGSSEWIGTSVLDAGTEAGLFRGEHSGPDGIAYLGKNKFLIGASREPRGLITVDFQDKAVKLTPQKMEKGSGVMKNGRRADFTDLSFFDGQVISLSGAADAICLLKPNNGEIDESVCWTYGNTIQDAKYSYGGLKSGIGKGLAVDQNHFYVVLDNKGLGRTIDKKDRRPLLLVFRRPA